MSAPGICLADIKEIRRRARQHLGGGALTQNYGGKVEDAIALLNHALGHGDRVRPPRHGRRRRWA